MKRIKFKKGMFLKSKKEMKEKKFTKGTIVKGKELKGCSLCMVLPEDMTVQGFQYKIGINEDTVSFAGTGICIPSLNFYMVQNIGIYLDSGTKLAIVGIPDKEEVCVDHGKFRTHRLEIKEVMPFSEMGTWEYLLGYGADIRGCNDHAVRYAAENGYLEMVKYLHKNGADIMAANNLAVRTAARNGHLETVRYLCENGADITAVDNHAVRWAAWKGHLEVVKYLHENGADITECNNEAVRWAAENGHLDVVEYLKANMQ